MTFPKAFVRSDPPINLSCPEDLTTHSFSRILQDFYGEPEVTVAQLTTRTITAAILSHVLEVSVVLGTSSTTPTSIPTCFIVKFLKESVPLREMFRVESTFYQRYAATQADHHVAFFHTPTLLYSSPSCIVLEKITDTTQYSLLEGCPTTDLPTVLKGLAQLHASCWHRENNNNNYTDLSKVPGMGSALNGLNKERQFPKKHTGFLERLYGDTSSSSSSSGSMNSLPPLDKMTCLCQDLATRRLREIHEAVHQYHPTLVHGDFHVGNLLKKRSEDSSNEDWYLLDWATCGAGNPLMDVVFFLLVSTKATPQEVFDTWLPYYYQALTEAHPSMAQELTYDSCVDLFRECLIDEFLILVCYDDMSRDLLQRESPETRAFFEQHFANVNTRAACILQSTYMTGYPLPPHKTREDLELEQQQEPEWRQEDHVITEI